MLQPLYICIFGSPLKIFIGQARAWMMLLIFDTLVFLLATFNAIRTWRELKIIRHMRVSLHVILLRDGAVYFGFMSIANLVNILTFYFAEVRG
ncbi:hypothetical protein E1B28_013498 [Marasmius oreades]|uniref:Uncharacterized protein n=1 Tax=Marasmius oreades TaxID=181124 RepID=A0A9P7UP30_9AGAR|nr:uncharacterized protein E1B28_013498 [Marasmius oreades]KAG7087541.1 hypothetical protein E1B28_013498 [Marasmius oreades]